MEPSRSEVLLRKYTFEHELGTWPFGFTQVVKDRQSGDIKTCKIAAKNLLRGGGAQVVPRLHQLKYLRHRCLSPVFDILEDEGNYYIISDRCIGGDLGDWVDHLDEADWLEESTIATYIFHTLAATAHCHSEGVFHGDLGPSSIALSSKLPHAMALVSDFGLVSILDPLGEVFLKSQSPYQDPDVLQTGAARRVASRGAAADVFSVGAVARSLLVGRPPPDPKEDAGWTLNPARFLKRAKEEEAWSERSHMSRDFVQWATQSAASRPTAADLLRHPWLQGLLLAPSLKQLGRESVEEFLRSSYLAYALCVLLVPGVVGGQEFYAMAMQFAKLDEDRDGLISKKVARRLLQGRPLVLGAARVPNVAEIEAALGCVDIRGLGVLDLCSVAAAAVVTALLQKLCKWGKHVDLELVVQHAMQWFFEVYGMNDKRLVGMADLGTRMYSHTGQFMEQLAGVQYADMFAGLDADAELDHAQIMVEFSEWRGQGTPLHSEGPSRNGRSPVRSAKRSGLEAGISAFMETLLLGCGGMCSEQQRDHRRGRFDLVLTEGYWWWSSMWEPHIAADAWRSRCEWALRH
eukprot:CAMPEP_0177346372 /NCGR_PEP_ID=MMETSP0368-20130122/29149_1 /TAXON_ID=447022 ORGANISM="Scrippsiella hangoei-like, Strain SHHI-4" /NCGR_SAMPLE_ID=MMETSP0368 /ASSEMBLY_ACC=CAM_ASM_000363 /LENGTH=574 /DNA_ID=CAMNT_0018808017 /DNA_START=25 /DNA_END=1750 /DNA_ORIENTATION=+